MKDLNYFVIAGLGIVVIGIILFLALSPQMIRGQYCYAMLSPVSADSNESSTVQESGCFDTFSESIEAATGGRVHLDPSLRPKEVTNEMLNQ